MYTRKEHSTRQLGAEPRGIEPSNQRVIMHSMLSVKAKFLKPPADSTLHLWFLSLQELWATKLNSKMT